MHAFRRSLLSTAVGASALIAVGGQSARAGDAGFNPALGSTYRHVLLISVDGMHAIDLANWIEKHPVSNIGMLARNGIIYPNAFTTAPSDSYPGMLAQVTGASPKTAGLFYDDSYDREEYPSKAYYTSQGLPDAGCTGNPGTEVTNFEALDKSYNFSTALVADYTGGGTLGQVYTQLDPDNMQRHIVAGKCVPVYPHEYVRTNTIFEIIKAAGYRTAWSDKHPAYEDLSGPSGRGLDELFAPEINSQDTLDPGAQTGDDYTKSFTGVRTYDMLKVNAVLNWIDGYNSTRTAHAPVPAIFGMNFQAVSVGQKLAKAGNADTDKTLTGGYTDANATPGNALTLEFEFVDAAIGRFERELEAKDLASSTLIIISAKHGQSPINVLDRVAISDAPYASTPGFGTHGFEICDDEALVWLAPELQKANYEAAKAYILANATQLHIAELLDRTSLTVVTTPQTPPALKPPTLLTALYGDPFSNSRVPDFIAITTHGAICTGGSKLAEHGGFSNDDRNVALMLSSPRLRQENVPTVSYTTQIAPTILQALGLDPQQLEAVHTEGTQVLAH